MYFLAFESPFLEMTTAYYTDESARLMKAMKSKPAEFMKRCFERVKQELDRAREVFVEDSWEKVRDACEAALFGQSHSWVARDGASVTILLYFLSYQLFQPYLSSWMAKTWKDWVRCIPPSLGSSVPMRSFGRLSITST